MVTATPGAVAAVMEVLGCEHRGRPAWAWADRDETVRVEVCPAHRGEWTDRGCPVAVAAADAAVAAATPHIAAQALREAAGQIDDDYPHHFDTTEWLERYVAQLCAKTATWLRARADRIEADRER